MGSEFWASPGHFARSVSENPVVGPRASGFSTGKDGEAGDIGVYRRCSRTQSSRTTSRSKPDRILRQAPMDALLWYVASSIRGCVPGISPRVRPWYSLLVFPNDAGTTRLLKESANDIRDCRASLRLARNDLKTHLVSLSLLTLAKAAYGSVNCRNV